MKKENKYWIKVFFGGLGTLLLGWLSQYLYEIINIKTRFNSLFSFIFDYPYAHSVSTFELSFLERYGYVIAGGIFGVSIMLLNMLLKRKSKDSFLIFSNIFFLVASIILYLYSAPINMIYKNVYREKNNIEIIKPFVTSKEYDNYISNYYQIQNHQDFKNLQKDLKVIAEEHFLNLQ